jgi:flagellar hook-associated protein 2
MVAATGIGSGLDIDGLVTQLVAAERAPAENRLLRQEATLTSELSAFGRLQGALSAVQSSVATLTNLSTFSQRSATSSNSAAVSASATGSAAPASYSVQVDQLAQAQSLASGSFSSLTETVGEGTLTFRFGTTDYTPAADPAPASYNGFTVNGDRASASVTIDAGNNTLQGVRDAINDADIGVTAAIVNDGSGYRLLLSSTETGADNSIQIQVADASDASDVDNAGLSRLAFNESSANDVAQTVAGQDARFSINGLSLSSASNSASDVIDGVSLTLRATTDSPATVSISDNRDAVRGAIEGFVNAYNTFVGTANTLTAFDAETGNAGPLQGDFTARSIINSLRSTLGSAAEGFGGPFSTLAELGITTQSDGTLSINDERLNAALSDNFDAVAGVFAQVGTLADPNISFAGSTSATEVGSYAANITQLATRGAFLGSAITDPATTALVIDDSNDSFSLSIDGESSGTISLTQGTYSSASELVAEIQSRINGDSSLAEAGVSVSVSFTAGNQIQIQSSSFGSSSNVAINSVEGSALGLSVASGTAGQDVAGSIGGIAATGEGQLLIGAVGSATEGIRLAIDGGATGARGTVDISRGIGVTLNGLLEGYLQSSGLLDSRTDGLQSSVDRIADDREALNRRLEALEDRYFRQFNALDTLLANLQSTGNFLTQQLAAIPIPGVDSNN